MATPAVPFPQLVKDCEADGLTVKNAEKIGAEIARAFGVQTHEVGILRVERQNLVFVYPVKLHNVGSIPLNTTSSVAVRTVNSKRGEIINNFAQTKHTTIFESVELEGKGTNAFGDKHDHSVHMIQKLMSAPVLGAAGVVGVIQVSRKGANAPASGPDFTPADLTKLSSMAAAIAKCFK
ncbi:MAG TPA: hypothetical protein VFA60_04270 [Terriglobales bacterium]|nr:hypothetical protein [Terriglobales bacterium]